MWILFSLLFKWIFTSRYSPDFDCLCLFAPNSQNTNRTLAVSKATEVPTVSVGVFLFVFIHPLTEVWTLLFPVLFFFFFLSPLSHLFTFIKFIHKARGIHANFSLKLKHFQLARTHICVITRVPKNLLHNLSEHTVIVHQKFPQCYLESTDTIRQCKYVAFDGCKNEPDDTKCWWFTSLWNLILLLTIESWSHDITSRSRSIRLSDK